MDDRKRINEALLAYLGGGGQNPGIQPHAQEERLRAAFPEGHEELLKECRAVIAALDCSPETLKGGDLSRIGADAREKIAKKFPWLEPRVLEKLGNYFAYSMR